MRQVPVSPLQYAWGVDSQLASDRIAEPEASILVTRQTLRPRSQGLHIHSADAKQILLNITKDEYEAMAE